jgi:beta-lactam-binding protein with PASTA domain
MTAAPDLVGLRVEHALNLANALGLRLVAPKPDEKPVFGREGVVVSQTPPAETPLAMWSAITVAVDEEGESGVHEPRRPRPSRPVVGEERSVEER